MPSTPPITIVALLCLILPCEISCSFVVSNYCPFTIWPGILSGAGTPELPTTGFQLNSGKSVKIYNTPGWSGRMWARTGCQFDQTGKGKCLTGDCGGKLECSGDGADPPATLFEITLGKGGDKDFYDVSLVDGYNLPIVAWPLGVYGNGCNATGCASDINIGCPKELQVVGDDGGGNGGVVACRSACEVFGSDQYCCSGEYANPSTCKPSFYSTLFKRACPRAYSYAFDDGSSTFTCKANDYAIAFCPTASRARKDASTSPPPPPPPQEYTSQPPPQEYTSQPPPQAYASPSPPQLIPQNHKHSNEGAKGETSSSNILHPLSLLTFGLGAFNLWC